MRKSIACLIIALMVLSLFGAMASAQLSPSPTGDTGVSFPPGFFDFDTPLLPPAPFFAPTYTPGVTKMNLSETETAAVENMNPGTSTLVSFALPFFFGGQALIWSSSNPGVASVTVVTDGSARINANGSGTALITVSTPDGSFSFSFFVVVN